MKQSIDEQIWKVDLRMNLEFVITTIWTAHSLYDHASVELLEAMAVLVLSKFHLCSCPHFLVIEVTSHSILRWPTIRRQLDEHLVLDGFYVSHTRL